MTHTDNSWRYDWSSTPGFTDEPPGGWLPDTLAPPPDDQFAFASGGGFILDAPDTPHALWGRGQHILWADGEALMIAGPQGVGKTTLGVQLIRARLGLAEAVLGYPVAPGGGRVLWLAMDRPAQARRAARRHFSAEDRGTLDARLRVHEGPPPYDLARRPEKLIEMAESAGADTLLVDSLKDAAIGLTDDEVGAGWNRARQKAIVAGVQLIELHHLVKRGANGGPPNTLADVYGSGWLTAGTGSVILLWGDAGDPLVRMLHLKQPAEEVGPLWVDHDHATGTSRAQQRPDLAALAAQAPDGLTAPAAAKVIFETAKPTPAQIEKARRQLDREVAGGRLIKQPGPGKTAPATYVAAAQEH